MLNVDLSSLMGFFSAQTPDICVRTGTIKCALCRVHGVATMTPPEEGYEPANRSLLGATVADPYKLGPVVPSSRSFKGPISQAPTT
jgi:hypothetical protein